MMVVSTDQWRAETGSFNCCSLCLSKFKWENNHMFLKIISMTNVSSESHYYFVFIFC